MKTLFNFAAILWLCSSAIAHAEKIPLWEGSANIVPCTTVEWDNSGVFGTPSPTVRTADQVIKATFYVNVRNFSEIADNIESTAKACASRAAVAAGITALVTSGAGAWEVATATFESCVQDDSDLYNNIIDWGLDTDTSCDW
jgi:hypothetical protein